MAYSDLTSRTLLSLCAAGLGLALACNPDKGDDTSASDSAGTSGSESSGGTTGPGPTTEVGSTGEPTTGSASEASSTGLTTSSSTGAEETTGGETTGGLVGCGDDPEFTASWEAWQTAVQTVGDTYYYSVLRSFGGFMPPDYCIHRTTVIVVDGAVVERRFELAEMVGNPEECDAPFIEKGEEVGTHMVDLAAAPATVETLYGACCDQVIHIEPAEEYMVTFATDEDGLMKQCYYVANGCADGCSGGPLGPTLDFEVLAFGEAPPAP